MLSVPGDWERYRAKHPPSPEGANFGKFFIIRKGKHFTVIVSDGDFPACPWEHVSVSQPNRTPTWDEMCWFKRQLWADEDTVVQYHPSASNYVNKHPHCLHMWRPIGFVMPTPPVFAV